MWKKEEQKLTWGLGHKWVFEEPVGKFGWSSRSHGQRSWLLDSYCKGNVKVTYSSITLCRLISEGEDQSLSCYSSQGSPSPSILVAVHAGITRVQYGHLPRKAECNTEDKVDGPDDPGRWTGLGNRFCDFPRISAGLTMILIKICFGKKCENFYQQSLFFDSLQQPNLKDRETFTVVLDITSAIITQAHIFLCRS